MSRSASRRRIIGACLLVLCCGKSEDAPKTPLPIEAQQFCDAWEKAVVDWCAWNSNCCADDNSFASSLCSPSVPDTCADMIRYALDHGSTWGTNAAACLAVVSGEPSPTECTGQVQGPWSIGVGALMLAPPCRKLLVGSLSGGARCQSDFDCSGSLVCQYDRAESRSYCGPLSRALGECTWDSDCADGMLCGDDYACYSGALGQPCDYDTHCSQPLVCSASIDGVCEERANEGEACTHACRKDLFCSESQGSVCVPRLASGETCTSDVECRGACDLQSLVCVDVCGGPNVDVRRAAGDGASGAGGNSGTAGHAGTSQTGGNGGSAGGNSGVAGLGGAGGGSAGGAANGGGGASGAAGAGGNGGSGGALDYCESEATQTLPFLLSNEGAYLPSALFPATGPSDLTVSDCSASDAGAAFANCWALDYEQAAPANLFAGINWVPYDNSSKSCFEGVSAVEVWAMGTPGAVVTFEAHGTALPVTLTSSWTLYSIPITADLNTTGVAVAFTVGFDASQGTGPYNVYCADPTYVE